MLFLAIASFAPFAEIKAQSVSVAVNFNTFQQELSPYGRWMNDSRYGQVWIYSDADFKPYYTDGHWEYTNYGWSWISDYDWGWAPFHYGRWENDPYNGWMWIPGYEWASAWVSWSSVDDYYGWAPLGYGVNINVSFGSIAHDRWNFIPRSNICDRDIYRYCVPYGRNNNFRNAVVINNYYNGRDGVGRYERGPERREAERYTNNRIEERRVDHNDRSWSHGNVRNTNSNGRRDGNAFNRGNNNNDNNGNGRRRNEANSNGNPSRQADQANRRSDNNNDNRTYRRRNNDGTQQNNGTGNDNNPRRRDMNQNRDNNNTTTPPVIENRRPQRDVNTVPQTNGNNNPGRTPDENRRNRSNDQQNNNPQRQQAERPVPQPQQRPQYERQAPATEQRRMERRAEPNNGNQGTSDNTQRGGGNGRGRRG